MAVRSLLLRRETIIWMRVATWNLWWRFGPWEQRQKPIADELVDVDADVCCLQEVWSTDDGADQAADLAASTGFHHVRSRRSDGTPHRFGNAVLSRWPILDSFTLPLPGAESDVGHRSAVFAQIDVPDAEQPWWIVCTHLEWRYDAGLLRQHQLEVLSTRVDEVRAEHRGPDGESSVPLVLAGDLNAVVESDELRRLTGLGRPYRPGLVFTDAWTTVGDGPGHTWTRDNPHSPAAQWPRRRLDHVLVAWPRAKPTGNPVEAMLFGREARPTDNGDRLVPSDHYGVLVTLDRRRPSDLE